MDSQFVTFVVIAAVLTVTPGADMALVTRHAIAGGRRAALFTTLGICLGCLVHAIVSALGLSVILTRSAMVFEALKVLGALYLMLLGIQALGESLTPSGAQGRVTEIGAWQHLPSHSSVGRCFRHGLLTNLLNPKVAGFYLTFLPQFIPMGSAILQRSVLLATVHILMGLVWLSAYATLVDRFAIILDSRPVKRWLHALTGMLLMGLGIRLALERR